MKFNKESLDKLRQTFHHEFDSKLLCKGGSEMKTSTFDLEFKDGQYQVAVKLFAEGLVLMTIAEKYNASNKQLFRIHTENGELVNTTSTEAGIDPRIIELSEAIIEEMNADNKRKKAFSRNMRSYAKLLKQKSLIKKQLIEKEFSFLFGENKPQSTFEEHCDITIKHLGQSKRDYELENPKLHSDTVTIEVLSMSDKAFTVLCSLDDVACRISGSFGGNWIAIGDESSHPAALVHTPHSKKDKFTIKLPNFSFEGTDDYTVNPSRGDASVAEMKQLCEDISLSSDIDLSEQEIDYAVLFLQAWQKHIPMK